MEITESRREYLSEYRKKKADKIKEYNRQGYLKRKSEREKLKPDHQLLELLKQNKEERIKNMNERRRKRRERTQKQIHKDMEELTL